MEGKDSAVDLMKICHVVHELKVGSKNLAFPLLPITFNSFLKSYLTF